MLMLNQISSLPTKLKKILSMEGCIILQWMEKEPQHTTSKTENGISSLLRTGTDFTESPSYTKLHYIFTPFRGTTTALANTIDDSECPHQTGYTWKYYDWNGSKEWKDAGGGLEVKCTGQSRKMDSEMGFLPIIFAVTSHLKLINFIKCKQLTFVYTKRPNHEFYISPEIAVLPILGRRPKSAEFRPQNRNSAMLPNFGVGQH